MRKFIALCSSVLLVLVVAMCSSPTDSEEPKEEFEPYSVGAFLITSPNNAEYTGMGQQKNASMSTNGDTVQITEPDDHALTIEGDTTSNNIDFRLSFIDSTLNQSDLTPDSIKVIDFVNPDPIGQGGWGSEFTDHYMKSRFRGYYDCDNNFKSDNPKLYVRYITNNDSLYRAYAIHVNGITETLNDIACN